MQLPQIFTDLLFCAQCWDTPFENTCHGQQRCPVPFSLFTREKIKGFALRLTIELWAYIVDNKIIQN